MCLSAPVSVRGLGYAVTAKKLTKKFVARAVLWFCLYCIHCFFQVLVAVSVVVVVNSPYYLSRSLQFALRKQRLPYSDTHADVTY